MTPFPLSHRYQIQNHLREEAILIKDRRWHQLVPNLHGLLYRIFRICPFSETTLCFDNDHSVQKLNRQFRNKNKPTNVLTFEHPDPQSQGGDIILALQTIRKEAEQNKRPVAHHLTHLILHGLLHLRGYDHIYPDEAREMEMQEAFLLQKLGIPNPWKVHNLRNI